MSNMHPQHIRFPSSDESVESNAVSSVEGSMLHARAPTAPTAAAVAAMVGNPRANESEEDSDTGAFHDAEEQMPAGRETGILDSSSSDTSVQGEVPAGGEDELVDTSSSRSNAQVQSDEDESLGEPLLRRGLLLLRSRMLLRRGLLLLRSRRRPLNSETAAVLRSEEAPAVAAPAPQVAAAADVASLGGMTPAEIQAQNRIYQKKFPNWAMSLKDCPALSHVQTDFDDDLILLGSCTMRRPRQKETAALYAKVLTPEVVAGLLADGTLSAGLAQDIGALLMKFKHSVPFNLVAAGLPDPTKPVNPKEPPKPPTEVMRILGIMVSNVDAALHFKQWYEKGPGDADFERDLVQPMLSQYALYLKENRDLRGLPLGRATFRKGGSPKPGKSCKRKRRSTALEYPSTSISDKKTDPSGDGDDESDTHAGKVVGGAYVFAVNEED